MTKERVPIQEKLMLTFEEASEYSGIGINRIRELAKNDGVCFAFNVGKRTLIKRRALEEFVDSHDGIK